jgi:DNA-directed RNA polymerase specialized sigma subunit
MPTQENKRKIEYLSRYLKIGKRIRQLEEERAVWLSKACKITQELSDMPKAKNGVQGDSDEVIHYLELTEEITNELRELHRIRREIKTTIATLNDDILQTIMTYKYIDGMTWEEIAVKLSYAYRSVTRLHGRALEKIKMS